MIKAIFWDFDGVIADSVNVKTDAFVELYSQYGDDITQKVKEYHLANGGMSRYEKIKYYQSVLLNQPILEEEIEILANKFSDIVLERVINAPYVEGVVDVLENTYQHIDNYVISGTPMPEMKIIIERRGLSKYFKDVYGSPNSKTHWTRLLIDENSYDPREVLFIGDATSDYKASINCNTHYLLRRHSDNIELFKEYTSFSIDNFINFNEILTKFE